MAPALDVAHACLAHGSDGTLELDGSFCGELGGGRSPPRREGAAGRPHVHAAPNHSVSRTTRRTDARPEGCRREAAMRHLEQRRGGGGWYAAAFPDPDSRSQLARRGRRCCPPSSIFGRASHPKQPYNASNTSSLPLFASIEKSRRPTSPA